jgi:hypothetical protein
MKQPFLFDPNADWKPAREPESMPVALPVQLQNRNDVYHSRHEQSATDRHRVLQAVIDSGEHGVTISELADAWHKASNEISGRFTELRLRGLIKATDKKRQSSRGKPSTVWVACEFVQLEDAK